MKKVTKAKKGDTGATGADGKSAYDLAVEEGYTGTLDEWLDSLIGKTGEKGDTGEQGEKGEKGDKGDTGADGQSAYDLAVEKGFDGTEKNGWHRLKGSPESRAKPANPPLNWRRKTALTAIWRRG